MAKLCVETLGLTMPTLVDELDDSVSRAYDAFPDRLFAIDRDGLVFYAGGPGPFGFDPAALRAALAGRFEEDLPESPRDRRSSAARP